MGQRDIALPDAHQRRLLALLATELPGSAFLIDPDGRVLACTRTDARLTKGASLVGELLPEALAQQLVRRTGLRELLEKVLQEVRELSSPCVTVPLSDGLRSVRVRVTRVDDGEPNILVLVEDVTELVDAEVHAERLASLAGAVAHELRNPLAGISGTLQVIAPSLDPPRRELLEKVQTQIRRVDSLVQELLAFARPVTAKLEAVSLRAVAERALEEARAAGIRGADVKGDGRATADPRLLALVLVRLLENAEEADAESVRIELRDGQLLVLDDGPGIAEADRARIFEPFFTTRTRGTGLGLPMARKAVEAMGGEIAVCPSSLGGAGLKVTLPPAD